jgi:hypothetical protein
VSRERGVPAGGGHQRRIHGQSRGTRDRAHFGGERLPC